MIQDEYHLMIYLHSANFSRVNNAFRWSMFPFQSPFKD